MNRRALAGVAVGAGALLIATGAIPRLRDRGALTELRAAGLGLFGDETSADAYARGQLEVRNHPRLDEKLDSIARRTPIPAGAGRLAALSYLGTARLSPDELASWLALRRRLAERSPTLCTGLWKGGISASDLAAGLRGLSPDDKQAWIAISVRAARLELDAGAPPPPIYPAAESQAWSSLFERLSGGGRALLERAADRRSPVGDEEACRAFRIFASDANNLPPDTRDTLIRAVTCPFLVARENG